METVSSSLQELKAPSRIRVTPGSMITVRSFVQPRNAAAPISFTEPGILMYSRPLFRKAWFSNTCSPAGRTRERSFAPAKAFLPMTRSASGSITLSIPAFWNAFSAISSTHFGTIGFVWLPRKRSRVRPLSSS